MNKRIIGINIPCYNEEENVVPLCEGIIELFKKELPEYDYRIQFIDNNSQDNTRINIFSLCEKYPKVRAIFNEKNYGSISGLYGLKQAEGDCVIQIAADFEEPIEKITELVKTWEKGYKVVLAIYKSNKEAFPMRFFRSEFYKLVAAFADEKIIRGFSGFGLYDRKFLETYKKIDDGGKAFRILISNNMYKDTTIEYIKTGRKKGKSKNTLYFLIRDFLITVVSSSTKVVHIISAVGFVLAALSFFTAIIYFILKLIFWNNFDAGIAPMLIGFFVLGSFEIFILGIIGEYLLMIDRKISKNPCVIEEKRLNFSEMEDDK